MENPGLGSDNDNSTQAAASTERSRESQVVSIQQRILVLARVCTQAHGVVGRPMSHLLPEMQQGDPQSQLPPQVQQQLQQVQQGGGGQLPPANQQWAAGGPPVNPQQRPGMMGHMAAQQQPAVSQQQQQMMNQQQSQPGNRALMQVAGIGGGAAGANASLAAAAGAGNLPQAALQELLRTLRSPSSPLQQQQVLNILRSNPLLVAAFIRHRAARYQGGQGGPGGVGGPPQGAPVGVRFQGAAGGVSGVGGPGANQAAAAAERSRESRRLRVQRCIECMIHTVKCQNARCSLPSCQKMKYVLQHTKGCKRKANGSCPICRPFISLCCYHANHCQDNICLVPLCLNIKRKLRQHRLQRAQRQRGNKTLNRG